MIDIKVTLPKKKISDKNFRKNIEDLMRSKTTLDLQMEFRRIVAPWKPINGSLPSFRGKMISNNSRIALQVAPFGNSKASRVFRILNQGSPPHPIRTKNKGLLKFQIGYIASTVPGTLFSIGNKRWGPFGVARKVDHPGLKERKFDELISKKYEDIFRKDVQDVINETAQKD